MWRRAVLLIVFILVPIANYAGFLLPGAEDQFSDDPQTLVNAAGYAFSIWAVIFTGMIAFSIQMLRREEESSARRRVDIAFAAAGLASIAFPPISIYGSQLLSWFDIVAHLVALIVGMIALRRHAQLTPQPPGRWTYFGPSMYLGWITAAFVISTSLMLAEAGVAPPAPLPTLIACGVLVAIAGVAVLMTRARDPIYGGAIAWALIAVGVEQGGNEYVRWTAWISAIAVITFLVVLVRSLGFYATDKPLRQQASMQPNDEASSASLTV